MNKEKPNCYECKHKGTIPGDCHSKCVHPKVVENSDPLTELKSMMGGRRFGGSFVVVDNPLGVIGNPHGIKNGWFLWPHNFDPIWLESCNGFEEKEKKNEEDN